MPNNNPKAQKSHWIRFSKYAVLLVALAVVLKIVFDGFSYYLARKSLDAELETKKVSSLEYLLSLAQRERALVIASLETRCRERTQIAIFHLSNAKQSQLAYDIKVTLVGHLIRHGSGLIDVEKIRKTILLPAFDMLTLPATLKPLKDVSPENPDYKKLLERAAGFVDAYKALADKHSDILETAVFNPSFLDVSMITALEQRLTRLAEERKENRKKAGGDWDEILSKNAAWTEALAGVTNNPALDEMFYDLQRDDTSRLRDLNCDALGLYYTAVMGRYFDLDALKGSNQSGVVGTILSVPFRVISQSYQDMKLSYFSLPSVAQTLFVTMFLGALGALTINVLRLSKVGWWKEQDDPLWGELALCPLLGAIAAFGIFLLGSTGLLLTSDVKAGQSGVTSLSAFFIGMLGFISGLLYDEAFGRVRRFGSQLFASDDAKIAAMAATQEDRALADILKKADASFAAELVLKFGIGTRVSAEPEFTLLVPSDNEMGRMHLADWRKISEPASRPSFEAWLLRHHAVKRIARDDVAAGLSEITVDDSTRFAASIKDDVLVIGKAKALKADNLFANGIVHILDGEPATDAPAQ